MPEAWYRATDFVTGAPEKYAHLVDRMSTIPARLASVVAEGEPAALTRVPARAADGDAWSVQRVLGHVAFCAAANRVFLHQMATMHDPKRAAFDPGHEDHDLAQRAPSELLEIIQAEIGETVELLSRTPDAAWGRPGYVRDARLSLRQMVDRHLTHLEEHIAQIAQTLAVPATH